MQQHGVLKAELLTVFAMPDSLANIGTHRIYVESAEALLTSAVSNDITAAFKTLLEDKHLYQAVEVGTAAVEAVIADPPARLQTQRTMAPLATIPGSAARSPNKEDLLYTANYLLSGYSWDPNLEPPYAIDAALAKITGRDVGRKSITFTLPPTAHLYCSNCKETWPFNPSLTRGSVEFGSDAFTNQWFLLAYTCQSCKSEPIRILIRRQGVKLRLCGRDPIGEVPVPDVLPKEQRRFFSSAMIASRAGQTLAGIFLLRVFIEQYWRIMPIIQKTLTENPRTPGESLGDIYNSTLPRDFTSRFPSLPAIYSELSEAMHGANADAALFDKCAAAITEHFDARRLYKLP